MLKPSKSFLRYDAQTYEKKVLLGIPLKKCTTKVLKSRVFKTRIMAKAKAGTFFCHRYQKALASYQLSFLARQ